MKKLELYTNDKGNLRIQVFRSNKGKVDQVKMETICIRHGYRSSVYFHHRREFDDLANLLTRLSGEDWKQ